jgi:hypothetical protein
MLSSELGDQLSMFVGTYLRTRNIARELHAAISRDLTFSVEPSKATLDQARVVVRTLQDNAAALMMLARAIKATRDC